MKKYKIIILTILFVFLVIQLVPAGLPQRQSDNPNALESATDIPADVLEILKTSCYDCHSNVTQYPWYGKIAPAKFIIASHIKEGKKHLNFSEWETYPLNRQKHILEECVEEINKHKMPLKGYIGMHPEAKLSIEEKAILINWMESDI